MSLIGVCVWSWHFQWHLSVILTACDVNVFIKEMFIVVNTEWRVPTTWQSHCNCAEQQYCVTCSTACLLLVLTLPSYSHVYICCDDVTEKRNPAILCYLLHLEWSQVGNRKICNICLTHALNSINLLTLYSAFIKTSLFIFLHNNQKN